MISIWIYLFCMVGLCVASKKQQHVSVQQDSAVKDSKLRNENHNIRNAIGALDQKVDGLVKYIKDTKELTVDKLGCLACAVNPKPNEDKPNRRQNTRNRRGLEVNGADTMANIFLALYDKAVSTASDVKTLLNKADEIIDNTQNCSSNAPDQDEYLPRSCLELRNKGHTLSGVYNIYVVGLRKSIEVDIIYLHIMPSDF